MSSVSITKTNVVCTFLSAHCEDSLKAYLNKSYGSTNCCHFGLNINSPEQGGGGGGAGGEHYFHISPISEPCSHPEPKFHAVRVKAQSSE